MGPPKTVRSWWRGLTDCGPLEKGMANHFSILALRTPWTVWEGKMTGYWKRNSPGREVPNLLLEISGEITPERMKGWSQGKNNTQFVDGTGDRSKVRCYKEQYCLGTWNVRSMNQGKLEVFKQEMARVNVDILGISKLKWTGMGEFNSDDHYIYYCGQESLRRSGVAIIVNKRVRNAVLGCSLINNRIICLFPRQTIQYHGNPSLCPNQ